MYYIQRKSYGCLLETVDEFETLREAQAMLKEYRVCDRAATYHAPTRACKAWKEKEKDAKPVQQN